MTNGINKVSIFKGNEMSLASVPPFAYHEDHEEDEDIDNIPEEEVHSPTDSSEDNSVEVKVSPISGRNKRKCTEPRRVHDPLFAGPLKKRMCLQAKTAAATENKEILRESCAKSAINYSSAQGNVYKIADKNANTIANKNANIIADKIRNTVPNNSANVNKISENKSAVKNANICVRKSVNKSAHMKVPKKVPSTKVIVAESAEVKCERLLMPEKSGSAFQAPFRPWSKNCEKEHDVMDYKYSNRKINLHYENSACSTNHKNNKSLLDNERNSKESLSVKNVVDFRRSINVKQELQDVPCSKNNMIRLYDESSCEEDNRLHTMSFPVPYAVSQMSAAPHFLDYLPVGYGIVSPPSETALHHSPFPSQQYTPQKQHSFFRPPSPPRKTSLIRGCYDEENDDCNYEEDLGKPVSLVMARRKESVEKDSSRDVLERQLEAEMLQHKSTSEKGVSDLELPSESTPTAPTTLMLKMKMENQLSMKIKMRVPSHPAANVSTLERDDLVRKSAEVFPKLLEQPHHLQQQKELQHQHIQHQHQNNHQHQSNLQNQHYQELSALSSSTASTSSKKEQRNYKNMTRERRIEANARERTRVHTISAAFDTLRRSIPAYSHTQKLSKLSVLRIACSYIMTLSDLVTHGGEIDDDEDRGDEDQGNQHEEEDDGEDGSVNVGLLTSRTSRVRQGVEAVSRTIQREGKLRKKKDDDE